LSVTVQASKHPLKPDWVYAEVDAGQSIYEIAGGAPVAAYINGREVPEELHRLTRLKEDSYLVLWPIPQGDDVLRTVAIIAVGVFAPQIAASLNLGATATKIATVGISLAGSLAINALIPPQIPEQPSSGESFNRLDALTGASNQVAAFQPIPRLYGTFRYFPPIPMTAKPFTEVVGDDQYLRMLVCLGYGPLEIGGVEVGEGRSVATQNTNFNGSPIRIGDTDINLFDDVEFEVGTPDQMSLYTNEIIETNPGFTTRNAEFDGIEDNGSVTKTDGESAIRTTDTGASEISLDFSGALYSVNKDAKTTSASVDFKIEFREVGTTNWAIQEPSFTISSSQKQTIRKGLRFPVPIGQYEVRVTRLQTTHENTSAFQNEITWSALRTIRISNGFDVDGTVVMALRIRANDQLNGRIENLSVLATSILPVYNGTSWVEQATNNPAWIYSDIWSGTANRRPVEKDRLDVNSLVEWSTFCETEGFKYNAVLDSEGTTLERAAEVAGAGLASWSFNPDSDISVVRDTEQTLPKMIISPRNSFDFSFQVSAVDVPEALRVRFTDEATFENTERLVFDDGFNEGNAEKYETLQAKGVTNPDQAFRYGRYHLAQQRLRPERFTFKQDVQHLRYKRGDLLTIQHDVILVGLSAGRVKTVFSDESIEVDEFFPMGAGENYGVKIQKSDGSLSTVGVANQNPGTSTLSLDSPVTGVEEDDLVIFGELGRESIDVKVTEIQPEGDFIAQITTVPSAPEALDALTGPIPEYDPLITERIDPEKVIPQIPIIDDPNLRNGATSITSIVRDGEGSPTATIFISISSSSRFGATQKNQIRYREVGSVEYEVTEVLSSNVFKIEGLNVGSTYEFQVRGVKGEVFSEWSAAVEYLIEDEDALASAAPAILSLNQVDEQLPPIGTVQSYIIVDYELQNGKATPSLVEIEYSSPSNAPLRVTYEAEASVIRFPINTYGEVFSVRIRARSVHGYFSEFSDVATITPVDPNITNQDLINFISNDISESQLAQDLNDRIDIIDENGGLLDRMDNVETSVSTLDGEVDNNATAISALDSRVTSNDGDISAVSQDLTQLSTTVDGNTSTIQTQASSINGLEAQYTVKIDNNGAVAGFGLASTSNSNTSGGQFSEFYVNADRFAILPQGGSIGSDDVSPFIVQNNQVFIDDVVIANASIDTLKVAGRAITAPFINVISSPRVLINTNNGFYSDSVDINVTSTGQPIFIDAATTVRALFEVPYRNDINTFASISVLARLKRNGSVIRESALYAVGDLEFPRPGEPGHDPDANVTIDGLPFNVIFEDTSPPSGTVNYALEVNVFFDSFPLPSSYVIRFQDRAIRTVEFKR